MKREDIKAQNIWSYTTKFRSASTVSVDEPASSVFRGPSIEKDFNFVPPSTFHGDQKEDQVERKKEKEREKK